MSPPSSSTSDSDPAAPAPAPRRGLGDALAVAAWMALFLAAADVAVDRSFRLPEGRMVERAGRLRAFFNAGRSVEAKLRGGVGPTLESSTPMMQAGWIVPPPPDLGPPPGALAITIYGMSYTSQIGNEVAHLDGAARVRSFAAPNATASHAYATYRLDRGGRSRVVVLGVLGSTVVALATTSRVALSFDYPAPATYPRYSAGPSGIVAEWPPVRTLDDLRARLADPEGWGAYADWLRATDPFYVDALFRRDPGDRSALARLVRRAVAHRIDRARTGQVHGPGGFAEASPAIASLRAIVSAFAADARADGKLPVILLIENQGFGDHLDRALAPTLARDDIPAIATHTLCPEGDPRSFAPDGHFSGEGNARVARALLDLIRERLGEAK